MLKRYVGVVAAAAMISVLCAAPVLAGTPNLDKREHHQMQRIRQGVHSGELTRPETRRLLEGQEHLRNLEAKAKADGDVTARERARLQGAADVQSKRIYRQKHDAQTRGH